MLRRTEADPTCGQRGDRDRIQCLGLMGRVQGAWQGDLQALMAAALDKDAKNAVACSTADGEGFAAGMRLVRGQGHGLLGPTKDAVEHPVLVVIEIDTDGRQSCCHSGYASSGSKRTFIR